MQNEKQKRLAAIFQDTQQFYTANPVLSAAVEASRKGTVLYNEGEAPDFPSKASKAGNVTVTNSRTFEAAIRLSKQYPGKKIAVLNFASATNPGGGVINGSSAQEESLCRCSTLYPALNQNYIWQGYYNVNRYAGNPIHTDACIYTPGVVICKTDTDFPERMPQESWVTVDVISCAAPNLRKKPANHYNPENGQAVSIEPDELRHIHEQRAKSILSVAADNNVDILVLGAFGCGAFCNDPKVVAKAYANALKDCRRYFDLIEFAVFCRGYETENYDDFANAFNSSALES